MTQFQIVLGIMISLVFVPYLLSATFLRVACALAEELDSKVLRIQVY